MTTVLNFKTVEQLEAFTDALETKMRAGGAMKHNAVVDLFECVKYAQEDDKNLNNFVD